MNSPADDVKDMLEAESLGLVFNSNLYVGKEPATPANCVTIFDTSGAPSTLMLTDDVKYQYPTIQVRVRSTSYITGYGLISDIESVLHNRGPETWNLMKYTSISSMGGPSLLDWSEDGKTVRFVCNFQVQRTQ